MRSSQIFQNYVLDAEKFRSYFFKRIIILKNIEIFSNNEFVRYFSVKDSYKHGCANNFLDKLRCSNLLYLNVRNVQHQQRSQKFVIKPAAKSKQKVLSHTHVINAMVKCKSVKEQIDCFDSMVKLPDEKLTLRSSVSRKLEEVLQPFYSLCSVHLVGSSVNGLGLKGCDVDLSLQHPYVNENKTLFHGNASFHEEISEGKLPKKKLYDFTPKVQLLSIRKILQDMKFEEPITVIPGRCPILNFYYNNLSCDLAINNSSALHGTNFMLLCGKLDERVPKLTRIINYWAKHSRLVGGLGKFKSYAIFLLVVFFLQTRNPPILPPVHVMLEKTEFLNNQNDWSYDVEKYLDSFKQSENTESIEELLKEFFFFYGNFDFNYIICPISSNVVDRRTFASEVDCVNNFVLNTICIQDPINLSWNVTTEVAWKHCKNFLKSIISICETYQASEHWTPSCNSWGLMSLIDGKYSYENLKEIKELTIDIPLNYTCDSVPQSLEGYVKMAMNSLHNVLNYCLLFQCYPVDSKSNISLLDLPVNVKAAVESQFSVENKTDLVMKNKDISDVRYVCVTKDTWFGRNTFSAQNKSGNAFEIEHKISKEMDLLRGNSEKEIFYFLCDCSIASPENSCLRIILRPLNSNRFIPKLAIFLKYYVPKLMQKYTLDYELKVLKS